jgi:predicted permease
MGTTPLWRRYLRFWGTDSQADVETEIAFHLEELAQLYVARGMPPEQAEIEALRRFGSVAHVRSQCVTIAESSVRVARRRGIVDSAWHDLLDAGRSLRRNVGFTVGAALILAFGIGLNITTYSFNKALFFPAVPIGDAQQVVGLWAQHVPRGVFFSPLSEPELAHLAAANRSFEAVAAYTIQPVTLTGGSDAQPLLAMRTTTNLFSLLRVSPAEGRAFTTEDVVGDGDPVVIVSHRTWQTRLASSAPAIGRTLHLNGLTHTVVGVMPEPFWFGSREIDVWIPVRGPRADGARQSRTTIAVARLAPGVSVRAAQAEVQGLAKATARDHPEHAGWDILVTGLFPLGPGEQIFFALVTILTGLLLAASCAHIANLLLAGGVERRGEIAIRAALGAGRGHIVRQLFVESVALSALGGVGGLLMAGAIVAGIRSLLGSRTPLLSDFALDGSALGVAVVLILGASMLSGLAPALRLATVTASDTIKHPPGGPIAGGRRRPLASLLIGLEVSVAMVSLVVTMLFVRTGLNVLAVPLGFETEHVMTFRIDVPDYKYARAEAAAHVLREIHRRLEHLPFIAAAGAAVRSPVYLGPGLPAETITIEDHRDIVAEQRPWVITSVVTPGYFEALGIERLRGRSFEPRDAAASTPVAVVSRSLADAYWPNLDAVGRRLRLGDGSLAGSWRTVIGVVADVRPLDPTSPQVRQLYLPLEQSPVRALDYFVAIRDDSTNWVQAVRLAVRDVDPELPVLDPRSLTRAIDDQLAGARWGQYAILLNAVIAVLLAFTGIYALAAFSVACRRREIAVRLALGATGFSIVSMLLRQALRPALAGVGVGIVMSALVSRAIALVLYGVNPLDPLLYGLAAIALCLAATSAGCFPALRATRVETMVALRAD